MIYILNNKKSGNAERATEAFKATLGEKEYSLLDVSSLGNLREFLMLLSENDTVYLLGGDGTLNHLINHLDGEIPEVDLYYVPAGSGNDFFADVKVGDRTVIDLKKYICDLPKVEVNGETHRFLNGVGYGIDGYCCEVGDRIKAMGKPVNYTGIAIKGLLFNFRSKTATVTVDGEKHIYENVWVAPTMKGRYYGGGMNVTPAQDRLACDTLSVCLFHGKSRLKTLMVFPKIFKGEHINHPDMVDILTGKEITVSFNEPCALQIDGETVLGVTEYTARA